jgi:uncharacterized membrane protein
MLSIGDLADSWSSIYSNSAAIRSAVAFVHIGGLVGGGGCAIAADRATLHAWRAGADAMRDEAARLHRAHTAVIAGLVLVTISGVLLLFANLDAYLHMPIFWLKMGLVGALLINGIVVVRAGRSTAAGRAHSQTLLALSAIASLTLWFATTLAGAVLPNVL